MGRPHPYLHPSPTNLSTPSECGTPPPRRLPKLVPEVEEGNVEYKLKLLNPSPGRFARLVTQLKWRLLEGGGQAYYELGVADSGLLIGLTADELEGSLQTLEEMAGDIGASVIVVREVEVPDALAKMAEDTALRWGRRGAPTAVGGADGDGEWDAKPASWDVVRRADPLLSFSFGSHASGPPTDAESDSPATEDGGAGITYSALDIDSSFLGLDADADDVVPSDADGELELSLFSMDPEPDLAPALALALAPVTLNPHAAPFLALPGLLPPPPLADLSIASVFKPRPSRRRPHTHGKPPGHGHGHGHAKVDRRQAKWDKREKKERKDALGLGTATVAAPGNGLGAGNVDGTGNGNGNGATKERKKEARDKRREEKRRALVAGAVVASTLPARERDGAGTGVQVQKQDSQAAVTAAAEDLVHGLEALHVGLASPVPAPITVSPVPPSAAATPAIGDVEKPARNAHERRYIVEALVVRKLSLEEAYLDFGFEGFEVEVD